MARRKVNREIIDEIRTDIEGRLGARVRVKANKGRRRVEERVGTLEDIYPNLFVVQLDEDQHNRKISFTYVDVLTEAVEVTIQDDEGLDQETLEFSMEA